MKKTMIALAALGALASGSAMAQQAGDWVVGAGWFHLSPQDSSKPLTVTYSLSDTGRSLKALTDSLADWGLAHRARIMGAAQ